jgi:exoribonuclease-2
MAGGSWLVRAEHLPLMFTVMGAAGMQRADKVRVQLGAIDVMALDVNGTVIEKIVSDGTASDVNSDNLDETLDDIEESATGPIALAMNVNEAPTDESTSP